ncbi:TadE-like protein [Promicromonospora sp. AC04]|uniref:TadE family protein n=1 Tax=Promicromonospora sp. AC04 TaxID=2135723 RepID=UPI000D35AC6E|nr:TadE family protein [Promicromonospora sp. AC04]PUB30160.1 TadE-like protein [Promicromonospora sp. AC04]
MTRHREPDERGQAAVELVGVVFLTVLVALLAIQGITVAQAASITQEAARNGARALSQGQDWRAVVQRQVPDGLDLKVARADLDRHTAHVRVTVSAPLGLAGLDITDVTITRTADFPVEQRRRAED